MSQPETNSSSRGRSRKEGGKPALYRPSRDDKDRYSGYRPRNRPGGTGSNAVDNAPPTILLKSRTNDVRSLSPVHQLSSSTYSSTGDGLARELSKAPAKKETAPGQQASKMTEPVKLLDKDLVFQDHLHDFLNDNPDFLVIGCVGLQWSGKSSVMSHLAASNCTEFVEKIHFPVCSAEDQNKALAGTLGLDAYVTSDRIIWIDCQPLLSPALAERELTNAYSKESFKESVSKFDTACIGTHVEVQSLQILTFLYCICHILIVVQDSLGDSNLIRLLQTAEMLKPNLANDDSENDHMPHLVTVYNRAQPSDLIPKTLRQAWNFYRLAFKKSRLQIHSPHFNDCDDLGEAVNFFPLLDWNTTGDLCVHYKNAIPALKRALLALPRVSFGPNSLNEKTWFSYASKAWEAVRKSTLMMEYARLLP